MLGDVVHVIVRAMLGVKLVALSRLVILVRRACGLGSTRVCSTLLHQLERFIRCARLTINVNHAARRAT